MKLNSQTNQVVKDEIKNKKKTTKIDPSQLWATQV